MHQGISHFSIYSNFPPFSTAVQTHQEKSKRQNEQLCGTFRPRALYKTPARFKNRADAGLWWISYIEIFIPFQSRLCAVGDMTCNTQTSVFNSTQASYIARSQNFWFPRSSHLYIMLSLIYIYIRILYILSHLFPHRQQQ